MFDYNIYNNNCYLIKIENVKIFRKYKLRLKYEVPKYKYQNKKYESQYSSDLKFKSLCTLSNEICRKKCYDVNNELINCGPSEDDSFVPPNRKDNNISWPHYKVLVKSENECKCMNLVKIEKCL